MRTTRSRDVERSANPSGLTKELRPMRDDGLSWRGRPLAAPGDALVGSYESLRKIAVYVWYARSIWWRVRRLYDVRYASYLLAELVDEVTEAFASVYFGHSSIV